MSGHGSIDHDSSTNGASATTGDGVGHTLDSLGAKLGALAAQAKQGVMHAGGSAQDAASGLTRSSRTVVREHPLLAVAIGIGLGVVLGRILFR